MVCINNPHRHIFSLTCFYRIHVQHNTLITYEISISAMYRILKNAGVERVSSESAIELRRICEEYAIRIAKRSAELTSHAKRKTVKAEDIQLAVG